MPKRQREAAVSNCRLICALHSSLFAACVLPFLDVCHRHMLLCTCHVFFKLISPGIGWRRIVSAFRERKYDEECHECKLPYPSPKILAQPVNPVSRGQAIYLHFKYADIKIWARLTIEAFAENKEVFRVTFQNGKDKAPWCQKMSWMNARSYHIPFKQLAMAYDPASWLQRAFYEYKIAGFPATDSMKSRWLPFNDKERCHELFGHRIWVGRM